VNGYSGFTPAGHDRLFRELASFPSENGLAELEKREVVYAVFHRDGYDEEGWKEVLESIDRFSDRLLLLEEFEEGRLYGVVTPDRSIRGSSQASRSRTSSDPRGSAP
jgi:hypothetical protein